MNIFIIFISLFVSFSGHTKDLTQTYYKYYADSGRLSQKDLSFLATRDIILVPGILAEAFNREDPRGVDFSVISSDYFASQMHHLKNKLKLSVQKLHSSSRSVLETKILITEALRKSQMNNRKAVLIAHSLGGLALLDYLLDSNDSDLATIEGILFMQSPFYGTPIADVVLEFPYQSDKWLKHLLPFFNTSFETVNYLTAAHRMKFMMENHNRIVEVLSKVPIITMAGVTNRDFSVFSSPADLIEYGCLLNTLRHCFTEVLFKGPYDYSDGLVPLRSSRLPDVDSVVLEGIDHGEPIVKLPFQKVSREIMTESLIKIVLDKRVY